MSELKIEHDNTWEQDSFCPLVKFRSNSLFFFCLVFSISIFSAPADRIHLAVPYRDNNFGWRLFLVGAYVKREPRVRFSGSIPGM